MLSKEEFEKLDGELFSAHKKVMREILNIGEWALSKEDFPRFKNSVFNNFGKSGLESETKTILEKYRENGE